MPSRPNHFEIPVDDPDRAEKFYGTVFGWTFNRYEGAPQYYGLAATGHSNPDIDGALFQRTQGSGTTITMGVDSIEDALEPIKSAGGSVVLATTPVPGMGYFGTCTGTEGSAGSTPHGATAAKSSSIKPPGPARTAGRTTSSSHYQSPASAA